MTGWQKPYVHHEFPKWIDGPAGPVIVQNVAEERCMRLAIGRDIGRVKANAGQRARSNRCRPDRVYPRRIATGAPPVVSFPK